MADVAITEEWRRSVEKRLQSLELRDAVDEVHRLNVEDRLGGIEESLKWLLRLIVGGLVTGGMAYLVAGGFSLGS
ncbi:pseudouridine synthase [Psychromarinibacter halotolerans]|uniref:Pseudouridine synthase n=1 Tax=Psychromarinibacter halotolerans TaxID=1775175 RepID=A0ABV7GYQ9_9RHOB|nr:pseudouridine synthase [Psychromarinibacter halotolerans]MDF0597443.1 pseudouridine synthase [Psychromarinibacter halotolerans]